MIKRLLASAILSSTLPAFAAETRVTDSSFASVALADGDYAQYGGASMRGSVVPPSTPAEARSDAVVPAAANSNTMAMIMAGVIGFIGLSARRGRDS